MSMQTDSNVRNLSYVNALNEAVEQEMELDNKVFVIGLNVDDHKGIQGTTQGLHEKFGSDRIMDTPLSEDAVTGICIGSAMAFLKAKNYFKNSRNPVRYGAIKKISLTPEKQSLFDCCLASWNDR